MGKVGINYTVQFKAQIKTFNQMLNFGNSNEKCPACEHGSSH